MRMLWCAMSDNICQNVELEFSLSKRHFLMYSLLECQNLLVCKSIRFSDDRNEIDFRMQATHEFDVNWSQARVPYKSQHLQTIKCQPTRVPSAG